MPTTYAIPNGATAFAATLYTSNGGTQSLMNAVNGVGFQPDLLWIKPRSTTGGNALIDSVRGVSNYLVSYNTSAEASASDYITSFNLSGWSLGAGNFSNSTTVVGWQWKAGGTAVSNTAGSITSTVSANTTAGFSVVTYTGNGTSGTIGHGLGVAPQMIIVKRRSATQDWIVAHIGIGGTGGMGNNFMYLDLTDASSAYAGCFNNTLPTTSVFSVGSDTSTNASGSTYVAYCYAPVAGYSAFGSYTGNGSTDGPFIYTGFRPRFLMVKNSSAVGNWNMQDSSRNPYNAVNNQLYANLSDAEYAANSGNFLVDFLSNGFKVRGTGSSGNGSGNTIIYTAFAENPFKNANAF